MVNQCAHIRRILQTAGEAAALEYFRELPADVGALVEDCCVSAQHRFVTGACCPKFSSKAKFLLAHCFPFILSQRQTLQCSCSSSSQAAHCMICSPSRKFSKQCEQYRKIFSTTSSAAAVIGVFRARAAFCVLWLLWPRCQTPKSEGGSAPLYASVHPRFLFGASIGTASPSCHRR